MGAEKNVWVRPQDIIHASIMREIKVCALACDWVFVCLSVGYSP